MFHIGRGQAIGHLEVDAAGSGDAEILAAPIHEQRDIVWRATRESPQWHDAAGDLLQYPVPRSGITHDDARAREIRFACEQREVRKVGFDLVLVVDVEIGEASDDRLSSGSQSAPNDHVVASSGPDTRLVHESANMVWQHRPPGSGSSGCTGCCCCRGSARSAVRESWCPSCRGT